MDELREAGKEVIFITVQAPKNSEDKILYGVRGIFAEYERAKIKERFRLGRLRKLNEGAIIYQGAYGYRFIRKQNGNPGYYEIIEEEAEIVRRMFNWIEEGFSIRRISKTLYDLNIKSRKSVRFETSMIAKILHNTAYIGFAYYNKTLSVVPKNPRKDTSRYKKYHKYCKELRPKEEWIKVPVPQIVNSDQFERVEKILSKNLLLNRRNTKYNHLLSAKVWCVCGAKCGAESQIKGKHKYYRCTARCIKYPMPSPCAQKSIRGVYLEQVVWSKLTELLLSNDLITDQFNRWKQNTVNSRMLAFDDAPKLEKEINILRKEEERVDIAYSRGLMPISNYEKIILPVRSKIKSLSESIEEKRSQKEQFNLDTPSLYEIETFTKHAKHVLMSYDFSKQRNIVLKTVDRVVASQKEVHIYGHIPIGNNVLCSHAGQEVNTNHYTGKRIPFRIDIDKWDYPFSKYNTKR